MAYNLQKNIEDASFNFVLLLILINSLFQLQKIKNISSWLLAFITSSCEKKLFITGNLCIAQSFPKNYSQESQHFLKLLS